MRLKAVLRSLLNYRLNSSVIIVSLAIGMACMNLITLFITRENNADGFQKNKNQIFALQADDPFSKGGKMYYISKGAPEYMKDNFAEVEDYCKILNVSPKKVKVKNQDYFDGSRVIATSANFFDFFSYQLSLNTANQVLQTKHDIVISKKLALKYFGNTNPIGQEITLVNRNSEDKFTVNGIFQKPEEITQLNFDMVRLIDDTNARCYLKLSNDANVSLLENKFAQNKENIPIVHDGTPGTHYLKSMKAAYFDTYRRLTVETSRNKSDLVVALVIAIMILGVALFNYLGLINNRLLEKTKEHSIRRINGGSNINLTIGFFIEILILVGLAFILSILFMIWSIPLFNHLTASTITTNFIFSTNNIFLLMGIPFLLLLVSSIFGFIRIGKKVQPEALKSGKDSPTGKFSIPVFHITQLAISVILIIGSTIILKQINFITNKEIGINKEVLEVKIPMQYKNLAPVFSAELKKNPAIERISLANASPVLEHFMLLLHFDENGVDKQYTPAVFTGDENYTKTLGITIIKGEDFSENAGSNQNKCIINESLAALFPNQNLVGKKLPGSDKNIVLGICNDFHYGSLKRIIEPGYISYDNKGFYLMVKPASNQTALARKAVADIWDNLISDFPLNVESIGERYEWMHRENENYAKLIGACCIISVFLSMIGLFAISFHASRRRIKEIGIRKVNGAKISEILVLLNKDFVIWVILAFIIALPVAWIALNNWLENFAYKTRLNWWIFALAGVLALAIALLTVSFQSWKAASRNPVEALRYE